MWPALQASKSTSPQQEYLFNDLLPFELKSLIFTEYYRDTLSFKNPPIFSPSHPSVVLSHVCGEWRAIALSMHELWTDVNVPFPDRDDKSTPYPYERFPAEVYAARAEALEPKLTAWLQRSGTSSPLRVTLSNVDRLHLEGSDYMSDFLYNREHTERGIKVRLAAFDRLWSIISPTSTRWTDLDIPMSDRDGGWILGMLQASVDHSYVDLGSDWAHQILMLPNLTSLKLGADGNGEGFEYCFSWLAKQKWTELRSLELRESHTRELEQVLLLLRACPNLEDLVLERSLEHYQPYSERQVPVSLPRLKSITFRKSPPVPGLLNLLDLPALRSFSLTDVKDYDGDFPCAEIQLTPWFKRFSHQLTELNLSNNLSDYPNPEWLVNRLVQGLLPRLTDLTLNGRSDSDFLLLALAGRLQLWDISGPRCQHLKRLVCIPNPGDGCRISEGAVLDFLVSRLRGISGDIPSFVHIGVQDTRPKIVGNLKRAGVHLKDVVIKLSYFSTDKARGVPARRVTIESGVAHGDIGGVLDYVRRWLSSLVSRRSIIL